MTANNVQPMSQRQADVLRNEWGLLLKMGYASQWTPAQKMARQDEIAALLQQAGQALPRGLNQHPDGHPKLLHCWPVKLLQAGRGDYAGSEVMIRRAAASLSL